MPLCFLSFPKFSLSPVFCTHPPVKAISEIGWASSDVPSTVVYLEESLGLKPYKNTSPTFTAVGDEHGLIIVVQQGRIWFPETGVAASIAPFVLVGNGVQKFRIEHPLLRAG